MIPRGVLCWRTNAWDKYSFKCIKKIISGIRSENTSEMISGIRSENAQKLYQEMYQKVNQKPYHHLHQLICQKTTSYLSLPLFPFPINHNLIKIPTRPQHPKRLFDHPFISGGVEYDSLFSNRFSRMFLRHRGGRRLLESFHSRPAVYFFAGGFGSIRIILSKS